jgi:CHAT domain-containing protein/Flp pilus assembly protein TadD
MGAPVSPVIASIGAGTPARSRGAASHGVRISAAHGRIHIAWALALLVLVPLADTRPGAVEAAYNHAHRLFRDGDLTRTQQEAELGYRRFLSSDPEWAAKFRLLEAQALIWRGLNEEALRVLKSGSFLFKTKETLIQSLTLAGVAYTYMGRSEDANRKLLQARDLCQAPLYSACGAVPVRRGLLALKEGHFDESRQFFLDALTWARTHRDRWSEASVLQNLGGAALQAERYDEAVDWSWSAYRSAKEVSAEDLSATAMGNLGWAYYQLGDKEKALDLLVEAEKTASRLGSIRNDIWLVSTAAYVYRDRGDLARAAEGYRKSLELARQIDSKQDIINALEDLAHTDVMAGELNRATESLDQLDPLVHANGNAVDAMDVVLARGEIAAARHQDQQAEALFRTVEHDPASQTSMRLGAEHRLARLYEVQGNAAGAEEMYRTALSTFEAARADLKNEESKLPFLANATPIYDDYIRFLVKQGRSDEALAAADQSRARTLAQGLEVAAGKAQMKPAAFRAVEVARKSGSSVLFYWLGEKESYLWAITAKKTSLYTLPAQRAIAPLIERYRQELLQPAVARQAAEADGAALFRMLVAPAESAIPPGGNVVVVCDGTLSLLNFETLLAPGSTPHYWIEDVNVTSAPSLHMLAAAKTSSIANKKLLLMGDAVSPNADYPQLPMARAEMQKIGKHFAPADATVFERQAATSSAYLRSRLREYAYIHFVAHGVASRTDPLDSAIILSRTGAAEDSFKLHAREILQHPIDARLVTISACYGGGTRSFAGEGLVGLSWAFLRAGAHNVIGALWEASDDSTPQLMDKMYAGLADGMSPSAALRQAKLAMLHSEGKFQQPFYWAPFQMYAGL